MSGLSVESVREDCVLVLSVKPVCVACPWGLSLGLVGRVYLFSLSVTVCWVFSLLEFSVKFAGKI